MDLGSKSRHIIMPMSSSFEEKNLHAEQQAPGGGNNMAKGSNNVIANNNLNLSSNLGSLANPVNNNANHNLNLSNNLGSLPDHFTSSTARPALDNHSHVNTRQAEPDNLIKPSHDHTNTDNVNNDIDDDNNLASSGITRISNNEKNNSKSTFPHGSLRYRECLKNHAANMGGYAVDGCGEFMPSGEEGSLEALKCAACGCHRNFHRRETNGDSISRSTTPASNNAALSLLALPSSINTGNFHTGTTSNIGDQEYGVEGDHSHSNSAAIPASRGAQTGPNFTAAAHIGALLPHLHHHHHHQYMHHAWMQQGGGKLMHPAEPAGAHHAAGMAHVHHHGAAPAGAGTHGPYAYHVLGMGPGHTGTGSATHLHAAGKRFRTKFTMEQREKMFEFSEKVGWRIQKQDEAAVQQFCAETGVKRHVLKVWMHNNKNTFGKRLLRFPEAFNTLPESSP